LAKQPVDLLSLETALFWAREIAEELGDAAVLYFIDMAIAEAKLKSPPTTRDRQRGIRNTSMGPRKKTNISLRVWNSFIV
jgi:hypothetical protein